MRRINGLNFILTIAIILMFTSCDKPYWKKSGSEDYGKNLEQKVEKMQLNSESYVTQREEMILMAHGDLYTNFYHYELDDSIKEMRIYIMTFDENGKWHKEVLVDDTNPTKDNKFVLSVDSEELKLYLGFADEDKKGHSNAFEMPCEKSWTTLEHRDCASIENIEKGKLLPLTFIWNEENLSNDEVNKNFNKKKCEIKDIYQNPEKIKELLGEHFMVAVEFN